MKDMPILVLSSQGGIEYRERAYQMGADNFMEKPLELRECLIRAQSLLRRYNAAAPPLPSQGGTLSSIWQTSDQADAFALSSSASSLTALSCPQFRSRCISSRA